jgi:hypothetical protein
MGLGIGVAKGDIIDFPYGDVADGDLFGIDAFVGKYGLCSGDCVPGARSLIAIGISFLDASCLLVGCQA